jgi:serine/threonine protein phosphatase PrpC
MMHIKSLISPHALSTALHKTLRRASSWNKRDNNDQHFEEAANRFIQYGCASIRGYRPTMEDEFNAYLDIPGELIGDLKLENESLMYFAVYDGHGGQAVSKALAEGLYRMVMQHEIQKRAEHMNFPTPKPYRWLSDDDLLKKQFTMFDQTHCKEHHVCGSTAATCFVVRDFVTNTWEIICASTGDSNVVLFDRGATIGLNRRHDSNIPEESSRVMKANCQIIDDYVFSPCETMSLAMTRAFGDYLFKSNTKLSEEQQAVIAIPEITRVILNDSIDNMDTITRGNSATQMVRKPKQQSPFTFLIVACDGIWDVISFRNATKLVNERLLQQQAAIAENKLMQFDLTSICVELTKKCLSSRDNITVVIALINRGSITMGTGEA